MENFYFSYKHIFRYWAYQLTSRFTSFRHRISLTIYLNMYSMLESIAIPKWSRSVLAPAVRLCLLLWFPWGYNLSWLSKTRTCIGCLGHTRGVIGWQRVAIACQKDILILSCSYLEHSCDTVLISNVKFENKTGKK